jgi:hypothetical protein
MPKYKGGLCFRDIEISNLALLASEILRILTKSDSLRAQVLKDVYFPHTYIISTEVGSKPAQIW